MKCNVCGGELILTTGGYICKSCGFGVGVGNKFRIVPLIKTSWTKEELKELIKETVNEILDYQEQAKELARVSVLLLQELNNLNIDTVYDEVLCRKLYKYGYINMDGDRYVLEFIESGMQNARNRYEREHGRKGK